MGQSFTQSLVISNKLADQKDNLIEEFQIITN